ncbi:MAG: orotidine 5'-phosphate decarboxylase [Deltaproteobacteria bacterium]|nr:orotidine 5'-phosphate decarboxylase [Deltaproteobacteria bacterium]
MNSRKIIPALDTTELESVARLAAAVGSHPAIHGFKVGFGLGLTFGLPKTVEVIRRYSQKPIIYDHQKAGTDIPDTGSLFARTLKGAGIDEAILFPEAGPETLRAWVEALADVDMTTIVGGVMTHPAYLESEGGFIVDRAAAEIYRLARALGVSRFVMPLTKPELARSLWRAAELDDRSVLYSPGYGAQSGDLARFAWVKTHYVIIGRTLLAAPDPAAYVDRVARALEANHEE